VSGEKVSSSPDMLSGQIADGDGEPELNVGAALAAVRERRGISSADVVKQSPIPDYYLRMIEKNDYSKISDPLYLLPFVRRYASFLALDAEEIAARFVREIERDHESLPASRSPKSPKMSRRKGRRWLRMILVFATIALIFLAAYIFESRRLASSRVSTSSDESATTASTGSPSALAGKPLMVTFVT
jgi:cytoskeletal protein RodZ